MSAWNSWRSSFDRMSMSRTFLPFMVTTTGALLLPLLTAFFPKSSDMMSLNGTLLVVPGFPRGEVGFAGMI